MEKHLVTINVLTWKIFQTWPHPSGNICSGNIVEKIGIKRNVFISEDLIEMTYFIVFRLAGHHIYGWRGDSINLYEGEFYNGLETFAYDDTEKLHYDNFGR